MTAKVHELKMLLKTKAVEIRKTKADTKEAQRNGNPTASFLQGSILQQKHWYRHHHIAYCLLRGRTYEQIERPAENNPADMSLVEKIRGAYDVQNVCPSQT